MAGDDIFFAVQINALLESIKLLSTLISIINEEIKDRVNIKNKITISVSVTYDAQGEIGVVLPQIYAQDPTAGTLFYLAVVPERRGSGLGRRLHAFGLRRLRQLGAVHYYGSTDSRNAPMLAIFTANGCTARPE